ncbi:hypothetical protein ACHAXN_006360 [Cyclotella atomus]
MASAPINRRHRPPSNPIPIAPSPPSELLQLLEFKSWPAVLRHIRSNPHEVGSSPRFRNERGYTALHCLLAYNRGMAGEELARVAEAMLVAAEEIDWGSEYTLTSLEDTHENSQDTNTNEVDDDVEDESNTPRRTGGAWRLLMDQNNQAQWSPLHLVFVQGGVSFGKVALVRALLKMNIAHDDDDDNRQKVLGLVDRQNRTMLHHLCETHGPRDDNFEAAHFLISQCPAMLFVRDGRGHTALENGLSRTKDPTVTTSGMTMRGDGNEECKRNYRMLKLLVSGMEREERRLMDTAAEQDDESATHNANVDPREVMEPSELQLENIESNTTTTLDTATAAAVSLTNQNESGLTAAMRNLPPHEIESTAANPITNNDNMSIPNVLHSACCLSKGSCPPDGSLIVYLASDAASKLEYGKDSTKRLADEPDETGNYALHIFLSNASYSIAEKKAKDESDDVNVNAEYQIVKELVAANPLSTSIANNDGIFPLRLAMDMGLRSVVSLLVEKYPQAVLIDPILENIKVFIEVLICISLPLNAQEHAEEGGEERVVTEDDVSDQSKLLSTMYFLVRSRPDVVSVSKPISQQSLDRQAEKSPSLFKRIARSRHWNDGSTCR